MATPIQRRYVLESQGGRIGLTDPRRSTKNGTQLTVATGKNIANQHAAAVGRSGRACNDGAREQGFHQPFRPRR